MSLFRNLAFGLTCFVAIIATLTPALAQTSATNSPYSRYGLGELANPETMQAAAQGNTSTTYSNPYSINLSNPAALASMEMTAYEIGLNGSYSNFKDVQGASGNVWNAGVSYLSLGFPLFNPLNEIGQRKKRAVHWGGAVGLVPFSTVAYNIQTTDSTGALGRVTRAYIGKGSLYQAYGSVGVKYKDLSLGATFGYVFGHLVYERDVLLNTVTQSLSDQFSDDIRVRGLNIRLGGQYEYVLSKRREDEEEQAFRRRDKTRLVVGATLTPGINYNVIASSRYTSTDYSTNGYPRDTAYYQSETISPLRMPMQYSVGLSLKKDNHYRVAVEYTAANWSEYNNPAKPETFTNTYTLRVGGEWIPDYKSFNSYANRVAYRAGFYTGTDPRTFGADRLTRTAVTLGLGLPLRLPRGLPSFINIGAELGTFGNPNYVTEDYVRLNLGFTLNDNTWFYKPKFN